MSELVTSEGDLPVVKILTTIFEQVDHDDDGVDHDDDVLQDVVTSFVNIFWGFKFRVQVVKSSLTIAQSTKAANVSKAFHRYALNYINALNYLETLRRQQEFSDFEKVPFWCLNVYLPTLYVIQVCKYMNIYKIKHEYFRFQWCNKDPRCKKLQLTDLLVAPVHHIMKV